MVFLLLINLVTAAPPPSWLSSLPPSPPDVPSGDLLLARAEAREDEFAMVHDTHVAPSDTVVHGL